MTDIGRLVIAVVLACLAGGVGAQPRMYKCKQPNDVYSFQADPCTKDEPQQPIAKDPSGAVKAVPSDKSRLPVVPPTDLASVANHLAQSAPVRTNTRIARPAVDPAVAIQTNPLTTHKPGEKLLSMAMLAIVVVVVAFRRTSAALVKDVMVDTPIHWPTRCAKCGEKHGLRQVSISATKTDSVNPLLLLFGVLRSKGRRYTLSFPACGTHAFAAEIAGMAAGSLGLLISILAVVFFLGYNGHSLEAEVWSTLHTNQKLMTIAGGTLTLAWITIFIASRRWLPVRLSRWEAPASRYGRDIVRLTFSSKAYAQDFERANRKEHGSAHLSRKAWYHPARWPLMLGYGLAAALIWVIVISQYRWAAG